MQAAFGPVHSRSSLRRVHRLSQGSRSPPHFLNETSCLFHRQAAVVIRGRVIASDTNSPLRRVQIRLTPMSAEGTEVRTTTTGDDGRYEFTQLLLPATDLRASKGGYVDVEYGQRRPFEKGRPIDLADRQVLDRVDLTLPPGAVVTGRVTDETGEPVARAWVQLARYRYFEGKRRLTGNYGDSTDDRGEFRIFGVPPAEYLLSASFSEPGDRSTDRVRYVRTYYPGTASPADAQRVRVKVGDEIPGLGVALLRQRSVSVSGVVRSTIPSLFAVVHARSTDGGDSIRTSVLSIRAVRSRLQAFCPAATSSKRKTRSGRNVRQRR
jgi:hypothetical protein